ncbi:uncharacterized protein OCT59_007970 [Rhizophagus irregularis]|uniref:DUF8211 domain-containing protein n=3 Tax=Rhizophagus irregularis TaxID=588596 RepID=U9UVD7_RHIID|nr:hypothetical protein GLOIN_2v1768604 [Rhizophagus irregularis DAOM 181602=DAOM 197198]EXX69482.1 hypothetical protein RirG_095650 [Rhizophagus irregularis DAOM 197198w]POG76697.1 hypothetical protein GLOIN_2v1768604 [Rhizophagus irregularis DAOM 181602=DAOM 197198]UZO16585.1 hypothetical protein OCT59_007970 [Rhizophagus irregularis]|eukprot:XP_025183563.1 hypothetical protein GLOIN_2v1768604 [Rhizophagus irregularis DAOM 181602=DAOM 197198]
MNNFQLTPSPNRRTAKKQQIRFERSCRRILSQEVTKPDAVSSTSTKLAAAKKGRFLFLPSQKFTTPLKHLRYKKTVDTPKQKDYNFTIPHYFAMTSPSVPIGEILYTVSPYNPIPDMFIPIKYRDIIPPDPIYDNFGSFIAPGSREWFTYMYQLDLDTRDERLSKADDAKFIARIDELTADGDASRAHYQQYLEERSKEITELIIQEDIRIHDLAIYHGTSSKHVKYRQRQASDLTRWSNSYHNCMMNPQRPTSSNKKKKKKKKLLQSEMDSFLINYPNVSSPLSLKCDTTRSVFDYKDNILPTEPYTSDDTKELEYHPSKRNDRTFDNNSSSYNIPKRSRLDTPLALDSEQAGSFK